MKRLSVFLALFALFIAEAALANNAVVTSVTGTAQTQVGTAAARTLRVGDELQQGATVSTGANSSVVLKFDDGQVAALTSNSRMAITSYQYNATSGAGNVLLSLINGGMRAITGLIGRTNPRAVSYRAATATIGIRGTDVTIVTAAGSVVVSVTEGVISFTFGGQTIEVPAGQAVHARPDGTFSRGAIAAIAAALQGIPGGQAIIDALGGLSGLASAINQAAPGRPRDGGSEGGQSTAGQATPGTNVPAGGAGGGSASVR